jgi:hypothetical protein
MSEIAEEIGVSYNSVKNNADYIKSIPGVRTTNVGRTTVLYYQSESEEPEIQLQPSPPVTALGAAEMTVAAGFGVWKLATKRARQAVEVDELQARAWLHYQLQGALREFNGAATFDLRDAVKEPEEEDLHIDLSAVTFTEEGFRWYLSEVELYESSSAGPVYGFSELINQPVSAKLKEADPKAEHVSEYDEDLLDEAYPSLSEIEQAGGHWFDFATELYRI